MGIVVCVRVPSVRLSFRFCGVSFSGVRSAGCGDSACFVMHALVSVLGGFSIDQKSSISSIDPRGAPQRRLPPSERVLAIGE